MNKKIVLALFLVVGLSLLFSQIFNLRISIPLSFLTGLVATIYLSQKSDRWKKNNEITSRSYIQNLEEKIEHLSLEKEEISTILSALVEHVIAVNSKGSILYLNLATEKLLEVTSQNAAGKYFVEVVRHSALNEMIKTVLEVKEECFSEIEITLPEKHYFEVRAVPLQLKDKTSGVLLVLHDITRIHNLEIIRKDFIANVSHELRTPLTTIRGYVETLLSGAMTDTKNNRDFLQTVFMESERMSRLVEDLLDLSSIESGKDAPKKTFFPLKELAAEVIENVTPKANELGVTLRTSVTQNLEPIFADRDQIKQVLLNLVNNAVKFNKKGGEVTIEEAIKDKAVTIAVKDTGLGIPSVELPRIFERFYRVDKDRSRKLGGTGLGLAIVKHIVNLHGGSIHVTSTPNEGSTFTLTLPQP